MWRIVVDMNRTKHVTLGHVSVLQALMTDPNAVDLTDWADLDVLFDLEAWRLIDSGGTVLDDDGAVAAALAGVEIGVGWSFAAAAAAASNLDRIVEQRAAAATTGPALYLIECPSGCKPVMFVGSEEGAIAEMTSHLAEHDGHDQLPTARRTGLAFPTIRLRGW